MTRGIVLMMALGLTACGSPSEEDKLTPEAIEASRSAREMPEIALTDDPEPQPEEQPLVNQDVAADDGINGVDVADELSPDEDLGPDATPVPAAFRGRWGMSVDDCIEPRRPGSTALEVTASSLNLPDGQGRLYRTLGDFPERYVGIFSYNGDRGRWSATEELALTGSSNVLIRQVDGGTLRYRRCTRTRG